MKDKGCEVRGGMIIQDSGRSYKSLSFVILTIWCSVLCDLYHRCPRFTNYWEFLLNVICNKYIYHLIVTFTFHMHIHLYCNIYHYVVIIIKYWYSIQKLQRLGNGGTFYLGHIRYLEWSIMEKYVNMGLETLGLNLSLSLILWCQ